MAAACTAQSHVPQPNHHCLPSLPPATKSHHISRWQATAASPFSPENIADRWSPNDLLFSGLMCPYSHRCTERPATCCMLLPQFAICQKRVESLTHAPVTRTQIVHVLQPIAFRSASATVQFPIACCITALLYLCTRSTSSL